MRATIVGAAGVTVGDAATTVTFAVTAGPGAIWGVGNGDPANQEPSHAPWRTSYHGLARCIVKAALVAAGTPEERALLAAVNVDAGMGPGAAAVFPGDAASAPTSITLTASAPGLPTATLSIPLSTDPADSVLEVAARSVGLADLTAA